MIIGSGRSSIASGRDPVKIIGESLMLGTSIVKFLESEYPQRSSKMTLTQHVPISESSGIPEITPSWFIDRKSLFDETEKEGILWALGESI